MEFYCESFTSYKRLRTREVRVGNLLIGGNNPVRIQTMTTTDTMDTEATVDQTIRCLEAGAELVRITAPSKYEAENLQKIKILQLFWAIFLNIRANTITLLSKFFSVRCHQQCVKNTFGKCTNFCLIMVN